MQVALLITQYYNFYDGILGYRRMRNYINHFNQTNYSYGYIYRLMRKLKLKSRIRRKKKKYVKSTMEISAYNVLKRNFNASKPNEKWCTDITEFKISGKSQKLYLSAIIDLYDRSIISYNFSRINNNDLVFKTFDMALANNPGVKPILHSDRGFQYTSKQFKLKLDRAGFIQSMSRVGKCLDNSVIEGFWGIIKSEAFYDFKFKDLDSLKTKLEAYIHFYNNERLQAKLKGLTPNEFRFQALKKQNVI